MGIIVGWEVRMSLIVDIFICSSISQNSSSRKLIRLRLEGLLIQSIGAVDSSIRIDWLLFFN